MKRLFSTLTFIALAMLSLVPINVSMSGTLLFSDDFNRDELGDQWISGAGGGEPNTIRIVDGRVEANANNNYIESQQLFSGNLRIEVDVEKPVGSGDNSCWDFMVEIVTLGKRGVIRFDYDGIDGVNIGGCGDRYFIGSSGANKGKAILTYWNSYLQFTFINDDGDTLIADEINAGGFESSKIRLWLAGWKYIDNVKVYSLDDEFIAAFVAEPRWGCAPLTVQFTDCSYGESITGWSWDFGDGDTSSKQNPLHAYTAGVYTVSLTITSPDKSDKCTRSQYIHVGTHLEYGKPAAGVIEPPGNIAPFCFSANGNDVIVLDVDAQSKGSPLNSYLRLYDLSGQELAYNDDTTGSLDSLIVYKIPNTGTYLVEIGDVDGNGGSDYTYTLSLRLGSSIKGNVSGGVVMSGGKGRQYTPLVSAEVWTENIDTSQQFQTWTDAYGDYELPVPEGSYRVKMRASDVLQYFNRTTNPDSATIVTVGAGSPATGINFSFEINNFLFREFISEDGYLTRGLVLGPLRNATDIYQDYLASIGGEANVIPREGDIFKHEEDVLTWQAYNFGTGDIFDQMFGEVYNATVYVAVYLKFDKVGTVDLWFLHNDAGALWLNGKNVWINPNSGADETQVTVKKDWNRMLVKVCECPRNWSMSVRFPNVKPTDISLNPDVLKNIGDVSGNGTISAYDASLILQFVVGLIDTFPAEKSPADGVLRDYAVSIPELTTRPGNRIKVPVAINDATGLTAGGIVLKYDPTVISATDALPTSLLSGAYWKANTQREGEIRFAFAAAEPIKGLPAATAAQAGAGNLFTVEFEPLNNTEGLESPIILETVQFAESNSIRTIDGKIVILPEKSMLMQNYPNPFNPETWIPYQLAEDSPVEISIYNVKGELVRTLSFGHQSAGVYIARTKAAYWDGRDNLGEKVGSGVYFYRLQAGNFSSMRKLVVLK